jgi:hypothetical protein
MKITFYPREIELFNDGEYDFSTRYNILLIAKPKYHYRTFGSRQELVEYLGQKGVKMNEPLYPLRITKEQHSMFGVQVSHSISQRGTVYAWLQEFS